MRKRGIFLAVLVLIALGLQTVNGQQECSAPNQKIFAISEQTNAHGELWNQNVYGYEICYDDYFRNTYSGDKHTCSQNDANRLFKLSSQTNAHAQQYAVRTYSETVCFGDLSCIIRSSEEGCSTNEASIISLSANNNAHLELTGQENYPFVICCQSDSNDPICNYNGICEPELGENTNNCADCRTSPRIFINEPQATIYGENSVPDLEFTSRNVEDCEWFLDNVFQSNMACEDGQHLVDLTGGAAQELGNHNITVYGNSAGERVADDTVLFEVRQGVSGEIKNVEWRDGMRNRIDEANVNMTVKLYAETTASGGEVNFDIYEKDIGYNYVKTISAPVQGGEALGSWFIDDQVIKDNNELFDCNIGGGLEFYFNASILGSSNFSQQLLVKCEEGENTPPRANISSPIHRQVYYTDRDIEFNHSSEDGEGNIIRFQWIIEDANGQIEHETTEESFIYQFTTTGQKTITLKVEDAKGLKDENQIAILAINSPGILAYIEKPKHQQILPEWNGNRRLIINYSGEHSYALNAEGTCPNIVITCLAGNCPSETKNYPQGCNEIISVQNTPQPFDALNFTWEFNDGQGFSGFGETGGNKAFGRRSQSLNDKSIILDLFYNDGQININAETDREFTLGQCVGGSTFYETDSEGKILRGLDTFTEPDACKGEDQLNGTRDDCCPANFACLGENGIYLCRSPSDSPEFCSDYEESSTCNQDPFNVAENEPGWDDECDEGWSENRSQPVECGCKWSTQGAGLCKFNKKYLGGGGENEICTEYECLESYVKGECKNGYMQLTINRELVVGECYVETNNCVPTEETVTVPCGRPTIELPFFGKEQFAGALISIALIYAIVRYVRRKN